MSPGDARGSSRGGDHPAIVMASSGTAIISAVVSIPVLLRLQALAEERRTTVPLIAGQLLESSLAPGERLGPPTAPDADAPAS